MRFVPKLKVQDDPREETGFGDTQKEFDGDEPSEILDRCG